MENTPAFTTATACNNADTGVGATMAAGNHLWKGINAAFPIPKANKANKNGTYSFEILPFKTPFGAKSKLPVSTQTTIMAGSKKTIEVPTNIPI